MYAYYIGKKTDKPTITEGERPCWIVRVLQAIVGIHWIKIK